MGTGTAGKGNRGKSAGEVTLLLERRRAGDREAEKALFTLVLPELRRIAAKALRSEWQNHALQPTELVNRAYLRLVRQHSPKNRVEFFGVAATMVRRILVDDARRRLAEKRGGGGVKVSLDEVRGSLDEGIYLAPVDPAYVIDLENALCTLEEKHPRAAGIIEFRFYAGWTIPEIAEFLGLPVVEVKSRYDVGMRWLRRAMTA